MSDSTKKPLVSFLLLAYNQEQFIREAVEGAFSQTYSPLEIILSDDCSSDQTFEIMREMAGRYNGPHKIVLNRNAENLGIGAHINQLHQLANGSFLVVAAGDDISLPSRVATLSDVWIQDPSTKLVYSNCEKINNDGSHLSYQSVFQEYTLINYFIKEDASILGAVCAWERECYEKFGPLSENIHNEDVIMPFRAALIGRIGFVNEYLVKYRVLAGSTAKRQPPKIHLRAPMDIRSDLMASLRFNKNDLIAKRILIDQKKSDLLSIKENSLMLDSIGNREQIVTDRLELITIPFSQALLTLISRRRVWNTENAKLLVKVFLVRALSFLSGRSAAI